MIQNKNNLKFKASTIYSLIDYFSFKEKLHLRLVSKGFNKCIKNRITFLNKENFVNMSRALREEVKEEYDERINKRKSLNQSMINYFSSEKKFSKKKTLVKLLNSKNYINIKKQVTLSQMVLPKKLSN